jgi:hypothetical protein
MRLTIFVKRLDDNHMDGPFRVYKLLEIFRIILVSRVHLVKSADPNDLSNFL